MTIITPIIASAQLLIDNKPIAFDTITHKWLATIPEYYFNTDAKLSISTIPEWSSIQINGQIVDSTLYSFKQLHADSIYQITLFNSHEQIVVGQLSFTFLPIISFNGNINNNYTDSEIIIDNPNSPLLTLKAKIKWRGGSTNGYDRHKRNYKIKLDEDHSLFGLRNDNNWLLDAGQADVFRFRNKIATDLWNDMQSKPYYANKEPQALLGVRGTIVELFVNNEYRGVYHFSENMDRKQMKVKKIDKTTGHIRGCLYKSKGWGYSKMYFPLESYNNNQLMMDVFEVKYPDLEDNDTTDFSTLYNAVNFVATSSDQVFKEQVAEYFDIPVLADYSLFCQVVNAEDNSGKNMFWAVYDKTKDKKLTLGVWDLDATIGQEWLLQLVDSDEVAPTYIQECDLYLTKRLKTHNVDGYNDLIKNRYYELRNNIFDTDNLIQRYTDCYQLLKKSGAAFREEQRWSYDSDVRGEEINFDKEIEYINNWIIRHMEVLDNHIASSILSPHINDNHRKEIFNLYGQRIDTFSKMIKGNIYIINGKKYYCR